MINASASYISMCLKNRVFFHHRALSLADTVQILPSVSVIQRNPCVIFFTSGFFSTKYVYPSTWLLDWQLKLVVKIKSVSQRYWNLKLIDSNHNTQRHSFFFVKLGQNRFCTWIFLYPIIYPNAKFWSTFPLKTVEELAFWIFGFIWHLRRTCGMKLHVYRNTWKEIWCLLRIRWMWFLITCVYE